MVRAHMAVQTANVVTVQTSDRPAAVAVALAIGVRYSKTSGCVIQPLSGRMWSTWCGDSFNLMSR